MVTVDKRAFSQFLDRINLGGAVQKVRIDCFSGRFECYFKTETTSIVGMSRFELESDMSGTIILTNLTDFINQIDTFDKKITLSINGRSILLEEGRYKIRYILSDPRMVPENDKQKSKVDVIRGDTLFRLRKDDITQLLKFKKVVKPTDINKIALRLREEATFKVEDFISGEYSCDLEKKIDDLLTFSFSFLYFVTILETNKTEEFSVFNFERFIGMCTPHTKYILSTSTST